MRTVFSNAGAVIQLWAAQSQGYARSRKIQFKGPELWYAGSRSLLFTAPDGTLCCAGNGYGALASGSIIIPNPTDAIFDAITAGKADDRNRLIRAHLESKIALAFQDIDQHRSGTFSHSSRYKDCAGYIVLHQRYAASHRLCWPALASSDAMLSLAQINAKTADVARLAASNRTREQGAAAAAAKEDERARFIDGSDTSSPIEIVQQWRAGERIYFPLRDKRFQSLPILLRLRSGVIETSEGSPISAGKFSSMLRFIANTYQGGVDYHNNRFNGRTLSCRNRGLAMGHTWSSLLIEYEDILNIADAVAPRKSALLREMIGIFGDDQEQDNEEVMTP